MFFKRKKAHPRPKPPPVDDSLAADDHEESGPPTTQFLIGEAGTDRRTVQVLLEAIARVSESRDLESLLVDIVDNSIETTGAERGLLLLGGEDGALTVRVARQRGARPLGRDLRFSTTIAKRVLVEIQPIRATVQSESEALELGRSVYDLKLRAVMCVPLANVTGSADDVARPLGVLYVDSRAASRQFSQSDLSLFAALAQHISIALEKARLHVDSIEKLRLEHSLELAGAIQRDLMPEVPEDHDGYDLHGWYGPAETAAGDFYDFFSVKGGGLGVAVGDVTGHGIGPALITATAQGSMRSYMRLLSDPGEVVTLLNQDLIERVDEGRFVTLFLATFDSDGQIHAVNAGHALPLLWRKDSGEILTFKGDGPALGMIADERYQAREPIQMGSGDVFVIYTDGLTEARNPEDKDVLFGEDGAKRILTDCATRSLDAKSIALALVEEAMKLSGGYREDDITVVVVRRL